MRGHQITMDKHVKHTQWATYRKIKTQYHKIILDVLSKWASPGHHYWKRPTRKIVVQITQHNPSGHVVILYSSLQASTNNRLGKSFLYSNYWIHNQPPIASSNYHGEIWMHSNDSHSSNQLSTLKSSDGCDGNNHLSMIWPWWE